MLSCMRRFFLFSIFFSFQFYFGALSTVFCCSLKFNELFRCVSKRVQQNLKSGKRQTVCGEEVAVKTISYKIIHCMFHFVFVSNIVLFFASKISVQPFSRISTDGMFYVIFFHATGFVYVRGCIQLWVIHILCGQNGNMAVVWYSFLYI